MNILKFFCMFDNRFHYLRVWNNSFELLCRNVRCTMRKFRAVLHAHPMTSWIKNSPLRLCIASFLKLLLLGELWKAYRDQTLKKVVKYLGCSLGIVFLLIWCLETNKVHTPWHTHTHSNMTAKYTIDTFRREVK